MRIRPIRSLERLCDAVTMIEAAFPCWSKRTGRDLDYFARRFPSHSSLYFTLDDAAGTIGVALPTVDKDVVVLDTEFVAPSADSPSARAIMANEISAAAVAMNATRMAVPARSQLAETYEEIGFAPTLFLQFDGKRSRYWRQHAIDQLRTYAFCRFGPMGRTCRRQSSVWSMPIGICSRTASASTPPATVHCS